MATINELGRITAAKTGRTKIIITTADGVTETFTISIMTPKSSYIPVTELDVGDYQKEMRVGDTQILSTTILPMNATNTQVLFQSSDDKIASINGLGRITA